MRIVRESESKSTALARPIVEHCTSLGFSVLPAPCEQNESRVSANHISLFASIIVDAMAAQWVRTAVSRRRTAPFAKLSKELST